MTLYSVHTYADGYGRWHARAAFTIPVQNSDEGAQLVQRALNSAKRHIRAELVERMAPEPVARLTYEVEKYSEHQNGALQSVTIRELFPEDKP